jgi:hypothetical protein
MVTLSGGFVRVPTRFKTPAFRAKSTGLKASDKLVLAIFPLQDELW